MGLFPWRHNNLSLFEAALDRTLTTLETDWPIDASHATANSFFTRITQPGHCLYHLLPPKTSAYCPYSLRKRQHSHQFHRILTVQKSFINLCLFKVRWLITGRAKKSNPLGKIRYLWNCSKFFSPNLQYLQRRIQATYPAYFIAIFGCIQKL